MFVGVELSAPWLGKRRVGLDVPFRSAVEPVGLKLAASLAALFVPCEVGNCGV